MLDPKTVEVKIEGEKYFVTVPTEVDPEWLDFVLNNTDMFRNDHSGYWARGVEREEPIEGKKYGRWLVWEQGDESVRRDEEPDRDEALKVFKTGKGELPKGWYVWDAELVSRAYAVGRARTGDEFSTGGGDASDYDVALQVATFGAVVYG